MSNYVNVLRDGTVTVLELGPKCKMIEEAMLDAIGQDLLQATVAASPPLVVIDLSHTEFFGSGFIEVLFRVWNRVQQKPGGKMSLCGLQAYCREVLEVTHLDKLWPLHATRADAVAALSAP
uniref:Anti-sigma factor antagonist n=1 Tax=Schlesneria paludicola TaxID=360056 RepID=A0A7C2NY09_9PLAN